jgi:ferredoxin
MLLKAINKEDLAVFVDNLIKGYDEVVGPVPKEFKYVFSKIGSSAELALDYDSTLLPPKKHLLPQREVLFSFDKADGIEIEPNLDATKRVIFGIHSCDLASIWLMDQIMAEGNADAHYLTRRKNTFIIGIDCGKPCSENSFCKSMGTLKPEGGYDLFLTDLGDLYAVEVGTNAGEELLDNGSFYPASYTIKDRFFETWRGKLHNFPDRIKFDTEKLPALLTESYNDLLWDVLEERCFDCGACTTVCPTCYCFDVFDVANLDLTSGERARKWDSCQVQNFAEMAGGNNMRGKRSDRLRHRLFRKGKYFKEKYGKFACVGCGRCGRSCLAKIDVMEIFNRLK